YGEEPNVSSFIIQYFQPPSPICSTLVSHFFLFLSPVKRIFPKIIQLLVQIPQKNKVPQRRAMVGVRMRRKSQDGPSAVMKTRAAFPFKSLWSLARRPLFSYL